MRGPVGTREKKLWGDSATARRQPGDSPVVLEREVPWYEARECGHGGLELVNL
jgi:hypothetical protein